MIDNIDSKKLNSWISMWIKPRETIKQIIETDPERMIIVLAALAGIAESLNRASGNISGDNLELSIILITAFVGGSLGGIVALYLISWLLSWTGKWLGGEAPLEHIRAAMAWSSIPHIWGLILWIPGLLLLGKELFTTETPQIDASPLLEYIFIGFVIIHIIIFIWAIVIYLKSLSQVQGFSVWKALLNIILAWSVFLIPAILLIELLWG